MGLGKEGEKMGRMSGLYRTKGMGGYEEGVEISFVSADAMNLGEDERHHVEKGRRGGLMRGVEDEWGFMKVGCLDFCVREGGEDWDG